MRPGWLIRVETIGTTIIVLMVGSMMIWYEAAVRGRRLVLTLGCAIVLYVAVLVLLARRSEPSRIVWGPFALAGLATGAVAAMINARFLVTVELFLAAAIGVVIGTAHWAALRVWIRLSVRGSS